MMPNIFFPKGYFDEDVVPGVRGWKETSDEDLAILTDDIGCDNMDGEVCLFHHEPVKKQSVSVQRMKFALRIKEKLFWADKNESKK